MIGTVPDTPSDFLRPRVVREKIIFVRVTKEEHAAIRAAAASTGAPSLVDFVREAARNAVIAAQTAKNRKRK